MERSVRFGEWSLDLFESFDLDNIQNMKDTVPECFYRISAKALVLNESRDKFLIVQESDDRWELPGGGLDWGATPQEDIPREIMEEMGIVVTGVAPHPSYFFTFPHTRTASLLANVMYETTLTNLDFTESRECMAVRFVNVKDVQGLVLHNNIKTLLEQFDPKNHVVRTNPDINSQ
jgi:8-oxo-dGTP diphosphatase